MNEIVILTGAGISQESEHAVTGHEGGIWRKYDLSKVTRPEVFVRDPVLVHNIHNEARKACRLAKPNVAHYALARLKAERPAGETLIVTMNVDDLHQRAGSKEVWHLHGDLLRARCTSCNHRWDAPDEMSTDDTCPICGIATTRPDVVWFGEKPRFLDDLYARKGRAKLFVQIGSSGMVYPANIFVDIAWQIGVPTLALNLDEPANHSKFDEIRKGKASVIVPEWVDEVLSQQ